MMNVEKIISPYLKKETKKYNIELSNLETNKLNKIDFEKNKVQSSININNQLTEKQNVLDSNSNNNNNAYIEENENKFDDTQIVSSSKEINYISIPKIRGFDFWSFRLNKINCGKKNN